MSRTSSQTQKTIIVRFRHDLRLADNPALQAASESGSVVLPVFIWSPEEEGAWGAGAASRWWLHHSLMALDASLQALGSRLIIRRGPVEQALAALIAETGADRVVWNRRYEPAVIAHDTKLKEVLKTAGCAVESYNAALLFEPWAIQNKAGHRFQVFTPFWKTCLSQPPPSEPLAAPVRLVNPAKPPVSLAMEDLQLLPTIPWDAGMSASWVPGEAAAQDRLQAFLQAHFTSYSEDRNRPDLPHTSRLSPHLHFGEISPRQIYNALRESGHAGWMSSQFLAEVGWREFAHHLLFHFPNTPAQPLRAEWQGFPMEQNSVFLQAWQRGLTGYPIVDAGMRELWATGWMHNRVRMIVASFLVKDLFLPWQDGANWFWDTLVDADLASNTLGWQWTAGCGADAAPYFRVFNPTSQGEKFDPDGKYILRWIPELGKLPLKYLHHPSAAPPAILKYAGIVLGKTYPRPIVYHEAARKKALEAYAELRGRKNDAV